MSAIHEDTLLMDLFREEVAMHADQITDGLVRLEFSGADEGLLESLMRAAHSLKGASRVVALDEVTTLAHLMEECFVAAQQTGVAPDSSRIDAILHTVDWIRELALQQEPALPGWLATRQPEYQTLLRRLQDTGNGSGDAAVVPATPAPVMPVASPVLPEPVVPVASTLSPEPVVPVAEPAVVSQAVKVNADVLNQFLGLASESLVEAHRFEHIIQHLDHLRKYHQRMDFALSRAEQLLAGMSGLERDHLAVQLDSLRQLLDKSRQHFMTDMSDLRGFAQRNTMIADRLFAEAIESRMRPVEDGCSAFPRMVSDTARSLGKKAVFELHGGQTLVDRDILGKLEAPLGHLIRNALDHGIEAPEVRERQGKTPAGLVRLQVRHHGGRLLLILEDDGAGIDQAQIRQRILEKQLATPDMVAAMHQEELFAFLFLPGFTTRDNVSDVSGRGVGLDAVQTMVHAEGGHLAVTTLQGGGTRFSMMLPVTRSVVRVLLVRIHGEPYAFPLGRVDRVLRMESHQISDLEGRCYIRHEDQNLALIKAEEMLGFPGDHARNDEDPEHPVSVVVLSEGSHAYAMEVSAFMGETELVVRPVDPRLGKVPFINSVSTTEDGELVLILDTDDLIRAMAGELSGGRNLGMRASRVTSAVRPRRILVVDDSVTVRELERRLLEKHGYEVDVAVDGADGLNALRTHDYQLVISDVDMPRMNGLELVKRLRDDPRLSELPVIIVSYKEREEDRKMGNAAGANVYLSKTGFKDDRLVHAVRELIGEAVPAAQDEGAAGSMDT